MNIAIDLGTSFTYVGTWYNGKFIPLIYGSTGDLDFDRFGYPTTIKTVSSSTAMDERMCKIQVGDRTVQVECFSDKGITEIKKDVFYRYSTNPSFKLDRYIDAFGDPLWREHSNGVQGTPRIAFRAFFEVLLNLTYEAVQINKEISKNDKTLDKIMFCFPSATGGASYEESLKDVLLEACTETKWKNQITDNDIYIESENLCITSAISSLNTFANQKVLVIDIGGATSDYCIKTKEGKVEKDAKRDSKLVGVTEIDDNIRNTYLIGQDDKYRELLTNVMLANFKSAMEGYGRATLSVYDSATNTWKKWTKTRTEYDRLDWQTTFGQLFRDLNTLATYENVDKIVLTGGGSKISNIKAQAQAVFPSGKVTTIEELAKNNGLEGKLTANNGVCYGAALLLDQTLKGEKEIINLPPNPPKPKGPQGPDEGGNDPIEGGSPGDKFGLGTSCDYDIRYQYINEDTQNYELMLFIKKGTIVQDQVYSESENLHFRTNANVGSFRKGKLKGMDRVSEERSLPIDSGCVDLPLRKCEGELFVKKNWNEYIGVIACKGISAMYFVVATYAGSNIPGVKEGTLINQAWYSVNPLPPKVKNAPTTIWAYNSQKEQAEKAEEARKKKLKEQAKQDAKAELRKLHSKYSNRLGSGWHPVKKRKLNNLKDTYLYRISICNDESKLKNLLEEAEEEFRYVL